MSARYLFRGKRLGSGAWVRGGIAPAYHTADDPMAPDVAAGYAILNDGRAYAVEQDSIGQASGLVYENGEMIFEGDLVAAIASDGDLLRGRVRFGSYHMSTGANWGWWIEWANGEFYRRELPFWRAGFKRVGTWADDPRQWDRWCEEAAAEERARRDM